MLTLDECEPKTGERVTLPYMSHRSVYHMCCVLSIRTTTKRSKTGLPVAHVHERQSKDKTDADSGCDRDKCPGETTSLR